MLNSKCFEFKIKKTQNTKKFQMTATILNHFLFFLQQLSILHKAKQMQKKLMLNQKDKHKKFFNFRKLTEVHESIHPASNLNKNITKSGTSATQSVIV